jgi:hypothetical protein
LSSKSKTYNVVRDSELDVVLLPDAPCVGLQSLRVAGLAENVLLNLEPIATTIVALDRTRSLAQIDLSRTRVL